MYTSGAFISFIFRKNNSDQIILGMAQEGGCRYENVCHLARYTQIYTYAGICWQYLFIHF